LRRQFDVDGAYLEGRLRDPATPRQRATSLLRFPEILRRHLISAFGMIALAPALVRGRFTTPAVTLLFLNELRHALRNEVAHEIN
jgi:hypothetical protein